MHRPLVASVATVAALVAGLAFAQNTPDLGKDLKKSADKVKQDAAKEVQKAVDAVKDAGQSAGEVPPGMDPADMQAFMDAATPGPMHAHLMKSTGSWAGSMTWWMAPGAPPTKAECTSTTVSMMDGKFVQTDVKGEIPGMGSFSGLGLYGYDNVSKQFQSTWIDNMGTTMMQGTGSLSADGKVLTWSLNYHCPITKKPAVMREVDTWIDANTFKLEMFSTFPKTGEEFKSMEIVFTRKAVASGSDTKN
jgi:hypothetical protein